MDYRKRKYYLVRLDTCAFDMRMEYLKLASSTLKIHAPYGHFEYGKYDGDYKSKTGLLCVQMMISCKKEDSELVEYELRKACRNDGSYSAFSELTKEVCGQ